jgi:hypothetical protein
MPANTRVTNRSRRLYSRLAQSKYFFTAVLSHMGPTPLRRNNHPACQSDSTTHTNTSMFGSAAMCVRPCSVRDPATVATSLMYPGPFGSAGVEDAVGLGRCEERVGHVEYRSRVALASRALTRVTAASGTSYPLTCHMMTHEQPNYSVSLARVVVELRRHVLLRQSRNECLWVASDGILGRSQP